MHRVADCKLSNECRVLDARGELEALRVGENAAQQPSRHEELHVARRKREGTLTSRSHLIIVMLMIVLLVER